MIANYGYSDGSGNFFITIDTNECNRCGACVEACPYGVLEMKLDENDPFREEPVPCVVENHRKKIKYSCAHCKPTTNRPTLPCIAVCQSKAITHSW